MSVLGLMLVVYVGEGVWLGTVGDGLSEALWRDEAQVLCCCFVVVLRLRSRVVLLQ